ncbi:hypothetical protein ONE63_011343 [Megalurothrips usitatus]|uniref:Uncharacterized protein n=1 Tax=Megalurothrips usitatus TaxID=439358 RepID=A0AAV7X3G4_9NEOP|nr:hypothetical protein ONE63_011343 [Megalurothrips usitatus]
MRFNVVLGCCMLVMLQSCIPETTAAGVLQCYTQMKAKYGKIVETCHNKVGENGKISAFDYKNVMYGCFQDNNAKNADAMLSTLCKCLDNCGCHGGCDK